MYGASFNSYMQRIDMIQKQDCTGCAACVAICPKRCIKMKEDEEGGFIYPSIYATDCINCGLCTKVCQGVNYEFPLNNKISAYIGTISEEERQECASGGASAAITDAFIKKGGVVYGCTFTSDLKVVHKRAEKSEEAISFRKSKYVQSNIETCFQQISFDLKNGVKVLFTGTSCQCAAICKYLALKKINTKNLYTINLLCHGVPSQKLFDVYLKEHEEKYGKISSYVFRNKKALNGVVNSRTAEIVYKNGDSHIVGIEQDPFLKMYYSKLAYRPSCMTCKFACRERVSDITLADAWKIEQIRPGLNPLAGISMIMVNTNKGAGLLHSVDSLFKYESISTDWALNSQQLFREPTKSHPNRDAFLQSYFKDGFSNSVWKFTRPSCIIRFKMLIKRLLRK